LLEANQPEERMNTMLKPIVTYFGTINDIQDREDLMLITNSFEVNYILDHLGYPAPDDEDPIDFTGLFVLVGDGDYDEIYAFEGSVPYLFKDLWRIDKQWTADSKKS
jgi:hypothetical protein